MTDIQLTIIDRSGIEHHVSAPTDMSLNLMEVCNEYGVEGTCGGMALCASCQCYIQSPHTLPEMGSDEMAMLDQAFFVKPNSRLGCQIRLTEQLDGLIIQIAPSE